MKIRGSNAQASWGHLGTAVWGKPSTAMGPSRGRSLGAAILVMGRGCEGLSVWVMSPDSVGRGPGVAELQAAELRALSVSSMGDSCWVRFVSKADRP